MKIVINTCYGGFSLSDKAHECLKDFQEDVRVYKNYDSWWNDNRHSSELISVIERLGDEANTSSSRLKVIEIPDDVEYTIQNYDGIEWVAEVHRTWS